jgi:Transposase DDE domain
MMSVQAASAQLFYDFCLNDHVPSDHLLRSVDGHLDFEGLRLVRFRRTYATPRSGVTAEGTRIYRASKLDCDICKLKAQCCPNAIPRDLDEDARDVARAHAATPEYVEGCRRRKKVEMLFAHLKRILRLTRLRLRGPNGARDEFLLAATAQNLRRLARLRPIKMLPGMLAA